MLCDVIPFHFSWCKNKTSPKPKCFNEFSIMNEWMVWDGMAWRVDDEETDEDKQKKK